MSFNASVPLNSDSPSIFPGQNQTNMGRLQTLLGADHQFNAAAAGNDGYHNLIHLTQQAPSGALAATGRLYSRSSGGLIQLFYMDDTGIEYQITPGLPATANVNFDGTGAINANQTIRSQVNVASVLKTATGAYTVNFTRALPDNKYVVQITGMRDDSSKVTIGSVRGSGTYANSVDPAFVKVVFFGQNTSGADVVMGNVSIYSL
jgi:hypothetical protein